MSTDQHSAATERTLDASDLTPRAPVGCVECRTRRLQCDTDPTNPREACGSCVRNGYICSNLMAGANSTRRPRSTPRSTPRSRVEKRRIQTACHWCRRQKIRCSGELPCGACSIRNQSCVYPTAAKRQTFEGDSPAVQNDWESGLPRYDVPGQDPMDVSPSTNLQPGQIYQAPATMARHTVPKSTSEKAREDFCLGLDKAIIQEYIEAFFRFVYPVSCMGFLHQATFLRQWHTEAVNLSLLKVVCGCALRVFSASQADTERAAVWMREAELDALQNIADLTIPRLQALTLLAFFNFTYEVHSKKALMLLGLAARLGFAKRLNHENPSWSIVEQESRRRLMWSIFVLDKLCSGGVAELTLCAAEHMEIRLPGNEKSFGFGTRTETQSLRFQPESNSNLKGMDEFAYTIRLLDLLRNKIHRFTKRIVSSNEGLFSSVQEFQAIDAEIDAIEQQLPADLQWNKINLQQRIYAPSLSSFVMLHTWRLQCKCDLYRLTILGSKDCISETALQNTPFDYAHNLRLKCLSHAIEMTKIWADVLDLGLEKPIYDPAIAGCAHQCAKVLTLMPSQSGLTMVGPENRMSAVLVCQMILDPLKDIYPKAKILYEGVCRMRSEIHSEQPQDLSAMLQPTSMGRQDMAMNMQATNEEQVRTLLNQFNG